MEESVSLTSDGSCTALMTAIEPRDTLRILSGVTASASEGLKKACSSCWPAVMMMLAGSHSCNISFDQVSSSVERFSTVEVLRPRMDKAVLPGKETLPSVPCTSSCRRRSTSQFSYSRLGGYTMASAPARTSCDFSNKNSE